MESHRYASSLPCCVFAFSFVAESILPGDTGHGAEGLEDEEPRALKFHEGHGGVAGN